jgi:hypothetical protein
LVLAFDAINKFVNIIALLSAPFSLFNGVTGEGVNKRTRSFDVGNSISQKQGSRTMLHTKDAWKTLR